VYEAFVMGMPPDPSAGVPIQQGLPFFEQLPPDVQGTIVNRMADAWGNRFTFEGMSEEQLPPMPAPDVGVEPHQQTPEEEAAPRSEQAISVRIGEAEAPLGYVELSSGPDFGAEALATTRRAFLFAAGGGILLAIIVGLLVSQGLTASLRALTAAASRISVDLSTRAPVHGSDEIGQLARQFNRMAERLEASFAALTADRDTLRRFIADASHELRTPITALKNFQELLRGEAAGDPAAREEFLAESAAQVQRLEWVTKNLLDLSRLDAGLIDLDLEHQDVGELIQAANSAFRTLARDKEILFVINPPDYPLTLVCDRARIQLALSNLLSNALKFTPRGGRVELGAEALGDSVRFWVQDNGPGIDPVDRPHIFERFYRGRGSHSEGSGLGLAIVQSVVQAHGGRVWVESKPETGSCFVVQLPRDFVRQGPRSRL
jgi:two-component system sensor histidine kinase BaeS